MMMRDKGSREIQYGAETGMVEKGIGERDRDGWPLPIDCSIPQFWKMFFCLEKIISLVMVYYKYTDT